MNAVAPVSGWGFKPKTDDMREAPSIAVVEGLLAAGAKVRAHDPVARGVAERVFHGRGVVFVDEPYAAAEGGRGRDGPWSLWTRAAPRTDPSERDYRTGLLPRVLASKRSVGHG